MKLIDSECAARIHMILSLSRSRGVDPVLVLDRGRLLRHPGTCNEDAAKVLQRAAGFLRELAVPTEVKTPLDMKNLLIDALERMADAYSAQ